MKRGLRGKRTLQKKVTSFNLYADQIAQIQAVMEATGEQKDAPLLRRLVDEGLAIRRRKLVHQEASEQAPPVPNVVETLETIQSLLLKMLGQSNSNLRVVCVNLGLLQETLAQVRANRMTLWEKMAVPALREQGKSAQEIADLLEEYTAEAKDFAYGIAEEIRVEVLAAEKKDSAANIDPVEEDQPPLFDSDTLQ
jgi:Spy/CpxP family protein refolding chaperone